MSDTIISMDILIKFGGKLESAIKFRCVEQFLTEEYINSMEDIISRTRIGKTWTRNPVESKIMPKTSREDRRTEIPVLKFHKCGNNEPLGTIRGHKVNIAFNIERKYTTVLRRPAYPEIPRAWEDLEKHIQELTQLDVLRKLGHNEDIKVKTPFIISLQNDKSRIVGNIGGLNTYTVPDRYPMSTIQNSLT
ncbi:hypothetical protein O181_008833 [Austropuccinia psidii MF-1]|uniref:Uncharacterized protein n=1 Tax=Austropuccinia psidii MF-1 TaxID=1389203 RepID=A0A9Q3GIV7_9BASI|nr:hypothetical protein [Austropuccinia psidii MF-1]